MFFFEAFKIYFLHDLGNVFIPLQPGTDEGELLRASIGSVDYIASLCKSDSESERIKEAARASGYGSEFVQAALSVDQKV